MSLKLSMYSINTCAVSNVKLFKVRHLLRQLCDAHVLYLDRCPILSLPHLISHKYPLAIVEFISVTDNGCMPYPVDLSSY